MVAGVSLETKPRDLSKPQEYVEYCSGWMTAGTTEDDSADEASNEKEFSRLLMGEGLEEEKEAKGNILEQVMKEVNKMDHEGERRQIYDMELSIKDYELDPEVQTCMTDWPLKPYAGLEDIEAEKHLANDHLVPINYYDNEDGFWDNYIK